MANHVYPLGYSTPGAGERIDELLSTPKTLLIDTRIKPYSWNEEYRKEQLEQKYGDKYRWAGQYLGNAALGTGRIEIADPSTGIRGLTRYLNEQHDLILLCQCKTFSSCHVSTICNLLIQTMPDVTVVQYNGNTSLQQYSNAVSLFDGNTALPDYSNAVPPSHSQEQSQSVSDVAFQMGDAPIPPEHQALFDEYCAELEWLTRGPVQTPLWCAIESGYTSRLLDKEKHAAYTKSLLCSGDVKKVEAAIEAMKRTVLKWDSSRGIAKLNRDAYGKREEKKLREKSAPKIKAWEEYTYRNPYYPDKESIERMKEREEEKLMERLQAYHEKWHSHPIIVEPYMGEDGYMVIKMPEGWKRPE